MTVSLCGYCGQQFNSLTAFNKHRAKMKVSGNDTFSVWRCLTVEEMEQRGLSLNKQGRWISKPMKTEVRPTFVTRPRKSPHSRDAPDFSPVDPEDVSPAS